MPSVQQTMMSTTAAAAATSGARDPRRHFVSLQQLLYVYSMGARDPRRLFVSLKTESSILTYKMYLNISVSNLILHALKVFTSLRQVNPKRM